MKKALVIHPYLKIYAGGEVVCLHVLNALVQGGYDVSLLSDVGDPDEATKFYPEIGWVLRKVRHVKIPIGQRPRVMPPGIRMVYTAFRERGIYRMLEEEYGYDVIFSTQSSIFTASHSRLIHFTYDYTDLYVFSPFTREWEKWLPNLVRFYSETYKQGRQLARKCVRFLFRIDKPRPDLIATPSTIVLNLLRKHGYKQITTFIPPARLFTPLRKKRQVIQIARIVQPKRLETYLELAKRLPNEHFVLIAKAQDGAEAYAKRLLTKLPVNMEFLDGNLRDHLDRLRESKVYVYTGRDRAIMLTVVEAISAGCYPIVSADSSALDVATISKIGVAWHDIDQLEHYTRMMLNAYTNPWAISKYAEPFRAEHFEEWVRKVARE